MWPNVEWLCALKLDLFFAHKLVRYGASEIEVAMPEGVIAAARWIHFKTTESNDST